MTSNNSTKYPIRFRGSALIPRLNQFAPCRIELTYDAIKSILESLYRRPMFLEMFYVDPNGREWELSYANYKKIIPLEEPKSNVIDNTIHQETTVIPTTSSTEEIATDNSIEDEIVTNINDTDGEDEEVSNNDEQPSHPQNNYYNQQRHQKHRRK